MVDNNALTIVDCSTIGDAATHATLLRSMAVYRALPAHYQEVVLDFVLHFYRKKSVYVHPDISDPVVLLSVTAANAALVGAAQNTHYFSCVKWVYFCSDDLTADGDAYQTTTVRLNAKLCLRESEQIIPGRNLIVHEFAHILDALLGISGSTPALRAGYDSYLSHLDGGQPDAIEDCFTPPDRAIEFSDETELHSEVEFFAVASEALFSNPRHLQTRYSALYADLVSIYGLDMAAMIS